MSCKTDFLKIFRPININIYTSKLLNSYNAIKPSRQKLCFELKYVYILIIKWNVMFSKFFLAKAYYKATIIW